MGHLCLVRALSLAPASLIQPFTYTMLIYAVIVGYFVFGDVPDLPTALGGLIIAAAGTYAALQTRERAAA